MNARRNPGKRLSYFVKAAELTQRVATEGIQARFAITYAQLAMLLSVYHAPGASSASLSRMHGITPQSSGEVIGHLVRRGYLRREASGSRQRINHIFLTQEGEQLIAEANRELDAIEKALTAGVDANDMAIANKVLLAIIANGNAVQPDETAMSGLHGPD